MHISKLTLRNYRNFKNATFCFKPGVNTLIGENGSGKTNVFRALRILLDDSLPRSSTKLRDKDFNRNLGDWRGHWIFISLELADLDPSEVIQSLAVNGVGIPDEEAGEVQCGNYNYFFRPNIEIRKALYDFTVKKEALGNSGDIAYWQGEFKKVQKSISLESYEPYFTCKANNTDFSLDELYAQVVGDFKLLNFPNPENQMLDVLGTRYRDIPSFSIYSEVSCTFAKALRDVVSDLYSKNRNPLANLLLSKENAIADADKISVTNKVGELDDTISNLEPVNVLSGEIFDSIRDSVGETYSPSIGIKANVSMDFTQLLSSLKLEVGDDDGFDYRGDIQEMSLGGANLIYITLKLLEYKLKTRGNPIFHLLLIEEPESHIHTHIQKTLFENVGKDGATQVIYSTHSTHISSVSNLDSINILHKVGNYAKVFQPTKGFDQNQKKEIKRIERFLDAIRTTLLFAKSVILVEGDGEEILIPTLIKEVFGSSLDEMGISLINVRSTQFLYLANLFHEDRIQKHCAIITDLDESINGRKPRAEELGIKRKDELDALVESTQWVSANYAKYTLEIELFRAGNQDVFINLIGEVYQGNHGNTVNARNEVSALLGSDDPNQYGLGVLRIADREQKGWLAMLITEKADHTFKIPPYILDALKFVSQNLSSSVFAKIARYRIEKNMGIAGKEAYAELKPIIPKSSQNTCYKAFLNKYKETLSDDPLSYILPTYDI